MFGDSNRSQEESDLRTLEIRIRNLDEDIKALTINLKTEKAQRKWSRHSETIAMIKDRVYAVS